jgi:tetratricopeptide (TPR) repeat protein
MALDIVKTWVLPLVILAAGFAIAIPTTQYVERTRPTLPESYEDADLNLRSSRLKGFSLGMEGLLADWYWTRSLQYIGRKLMTVDGETIDVDDLRGLNPRLLYPLLDTATDLDPRYMAAYSYGAIVLPAIDPEKAIAIAKKGIANNPLEWRLHQHLGYIYWKLERYEEAARTYEQGAEIPGAAPFMKIMSAQMRTQGGSRDTARQMFRQMLADNDDPQVRITAQRRLMGLDSLDERDAIDNALEQYRQVRGVCATRLAEIIPQLQGVRLPGGRDFAVDRAGNLVDPSGAPYVLDREECKVKLDLKRTGLPTR